MRTLSAMPYKQPRSVQVVVFRETKEKRLYLLLKRLSSHGGFWQSVTGSLEEGETHTQAAVRELREETGMSAREDELIDLELTNLFDIAAQWLPRYAPGVTQNAELCYALRVNAEQVQLDASEHEDYVWVDYETATGMLYWESNRRALDATDRLGGFLPQRPKDTKPH